MTSERQTKANRQNALLSTGPKTPAGKAVSALNALKHGFLAHEALLPSEDENAFRELQERLQTELQPLGEVERLLVERIAGACWKLKRLGRVEAGIFAWQYYGLKADRAEQQVKAYERTEDWDPVFLKALAHGKTVITDEEKHTEAKAQLEEIRAQQEAELPTLGLAFVRDANGADAFGKLSRYEAAIERSLYKALHELQRLQAARSGQPVPPPVAVDVDVTVASQDAGGEG
jgi:hypothetical protein